MADKSIIVGAVVFLLAGLGTGTGAVLTAKHRFDVLSAGGEAEATITKIDVRTSRDSKGKTSTGYYPVAEFKLPSGDNVSIRSNTSNGKDGFAVGDKVKVVYDPAKPHDGMIATFGQLWTLPLILGLFGTAFTFGGIMVWRVFGRDPFFSHGGMSRASRMKDKDEDKDEAAA